MKFKTISEFNEYVSLEPARISQLDIGKYPKDYLLKSQIVYPQFYRISLKYGLEEDKTKGYMYFSSPNQPIDWDTDTALSGFYIQLTDEFISIHQNLKFSFLTYGIHDPLVLNSTEENTISILLESAYNEYLKEPLSTELMVSYINLIFTHIAEFYARQFTEEKSDFSKIVDDFFIELGKYYNSNKVKELPNVSYFANRLNFTPNYLSDVIKSHTGKPALEHIHQLIIETSKPLLKEKKLSLKEIAYQLGFDYPSYFSRLFKNVVGISPSKYRQK